MKTTFANRPTTYWIALSAVVLAMVLASVAAQPPEPEPIVVNKAPSAVTFVGGTAKVMGRLKVRIAGPDGRTVFESISESGLIDWIPGSDLPDGHYRWDAWFVPRAELDRVHKEGIPDDNEPTPARYRSGVFRIKSGLLEPWNDKGSDAGEVQLGWAEKAVDRLLDSLVPLAHAGVTHGSNHVLIEGPSASVRSDDTANDNGLDWVVGMDRFEFSVIDQDGEGSRPFVIEHGVPDNALFLEDGAGHVGLGTSDPAVPLHIADTVPRLRFEDTDGFGTSGPTAWTISASSDEFRLQDNDGGGRPLVIDAGGDSGGAPTNSLFIAADGDIGLGTSTPEADLHVVGPSGSLALEGTSSGRKWAQFVGGGSGPFLLQDRNSGLIPFIVRAGAPTSSLDIDSNGNVGMGTFDMETALHVERSDGSAQVLVRESSSTAAARELFKLSNNGGPFFIFENRDISQSYSFAMGATGHFLLSHQQTSGVQFRLRPDGSAAFQGDVTANGVLLTSSREAKTDFAPVDEQTVLEKVTELDVSQWRYRREPESARHVGPMAEDFQEVFGLGDGRHISAGDGIGIALGAIKALERKNASLSRENRELRKALDSVRQRVTRLESRQ